MMITVSDKGLVDGLDRARKSVRDFAASIGDSVHQVIYGYTELRSGNCWVLAVQHGGVIPAIESRMSLERRMGRTLANVRR